MACHGGPNLVEDNLVLCLDAGNTKSYPILSSISMVASAYGDNPSSGPVQVTAPAGIQAGDLLIIMSSVPNASNIDSNIPTGFTKIEDSENTVVDHRISYKIAVGNESGTTYSGQTGNAGEGNMNIFVFRGNISFSSVSVVATYAWNTSGSGPSSVSVDAGTGGKALSIITTSSRSSNTNTISPTAPSSGWTTYNNINGTGNDEVQALSWNFHTRDGNVTANTSYGDDARATAIACVLNFTNPWKDITGNGVTGTLENGPTFNSGNGGYIVFDGTDDYVSTINDIVLEEEDFTMGFWAFTDDVSTTNRSLASSVTNMDSNGWQDAGSWQISFSNSSELKMGVRNNAGDAGGSITSNSIVSTGTWYYFVITGATGGNYKIYFNGEEDESKNNVGGDNGTDLDCPNFAIGINRSYASEWDGGIAIVQVYKGKALSAAEVKQNYNAHKGRYGL